MSDFLVRPLGPLMVDVEGLVLTASDRELLRHPLVGAVILFARNYDSPQQLRELTSAIRAVRSPSLLIAVDQEGGRVQRFQTGFTRLPAARLLGTLYETAPERAVECAEQVGLIMAAELRAHGVDISFAPVLDLDYGRSAVIGNRAFHRDPRIVGVLAARLARGMRLGGMAAIGKHFPGHGYAEADSHHEVPRDDRTLDEIMKADIDPYRVVIAAGLAGVMPAHVIYTSVDPAAPAGFSSGWIQGILRARLGFRGLVFSDDLSMEGASVAGGIVDRARAAFTAGCDMVLVCNAPEAARSLVRDLEARSLDPQLARLMQPTPDRAVRSRYMEARRLLAQQLPT